MIVNEKQAEARLSSPMNLMNRLRRESDRSNAMKLFIPTRKQEELHKTENKIVPYINKDFNPFLHQPNPPAPGHIDIPVPVPVPVPEPTKLSDILENSDSQIKLGLAHDKALELLVNSVNQLAAKLDDVKADKLPSVISAASKTVESIRRERSEAAKNGKDREVHYHFYTPEQKKISDYKVIDVT